MSYYPPYPVFTAVGFIIHTLVFFAISIPLLVKRKTSAVIFLGIGVLAYALDFLAIVVLFYFFPNNILKTHAFVFISSVLVPVGTVFLLMSALAISPKLQKWSWVLFVVGSAFIVYSYIQIATGLRDIYVPGQSMVHPAYPAATAQNQAFGGIGGGVIFGLFFLYHAFWSTLFVKYRAVVIGIGSFLLGLSSYYWISTNAALYITTHLIGIIGSLTVLIGFRFMDVHNEETNTTREA